MRLAAAVAVVAVVTALIFLVVPVRSDMTILLPEGRGGDLGMLFTNLREGPANRTVLIALAPADGQALARPRPLSHAYREALERSGRFDLVANGEVPSGDAALKPFFDFRYRLNPPLDLASFSRDGLHRALEDLLRDLRGFSGMAVQRIMAADPTLRTLAVATLWQPPPLKTRQGVWIDEEGARVLLLARTKGEGYDFAAQAATFDTMRRAAAALEPEFGAVRLILSGPSVIAEESRVRAEAEARRLVLISVPLVAGLLLLFLRRFSALPLLFLPLGCGFAAATAVTALVFGDVHVTTLGFGVTLLGVAVDYPLHLMARVRAGQAPAAAARRIWGALLIAASTTIIAFLPLAVSSFPGLAQLGLFSVAGLAAAVAATRWLLPALIGPTDAASVGGARWPATIHRRLGAGRVVALIAGLAAVAFLILRPAPLWLQDLAVLSPIPESLRSHDARLRRDLKVPDPRHIIVVAGDDVEAALARSETLLPGLSRLQADGHLLGFDMAARYLPSAAAQTSRIAALPDDMRLRANLGAALEGLPFRPGTFEPFLQAVAAMRKAGPVRLSDLSASPLEARLSPMVLHVPTGVQALILLRGLRNPAELQKMIDTSAIPGVRYLDLKATAQGIMDGYRAETMRWVAIGAVLALGLLAATLRSLAGVVAVVVPVLLSILLTTAVLALMNSGLSIFHLLGLLMVAGLGIDYAVFLRQGDDDGFAGGGVRAVTLCAATSFAMFALLATAAVPILSQIGWTVAIGSAFSLLLTLVFTAPARDRAS